MSLIQKVDIKFVVTFLGFKKSSLLLVSFVVLFSCVFTLSASMNASDFSDVSGLTTTVSLEDQNVDDSLTGTANPAAVYCNELGYGYRIDNEPRGQVGYCIFPDGSECDEWLFFEGTCEPEWSYCVINGYNTIIKTDGKDPFSREYAVCVSDGNEIGSVTELMGLDELCLGCNTQLEKENKEKIKLVQDKKPKLFENAGYQK